MKRFFLIIILFIFINCIKNNSVFTILYVGTSSCDACLEMNNTLKEINKEYKNKVKVLFYDISEKEGLEKYNLYSGKSIPLTVFFNKQGHKFFVSQSKLPKDAIIAILKAEGLK